MENRIFDEIKKQVWGDPIIYLKFTSKLEYAEDILNGTFYANSPAFFRKKELESQERGQGDRNELKYNLPLFDLKFYDLESKEHQFTIEHASGVIERKTDEDIPMVSFVGIPLGKMEIVEQDAFRITFAFPFSDSEYESLTEKFGEYCVLLNPSSLMVRLQELSDKSPIRFEPVKYVESDSFGKANAHIIGSSDRFFYKDKDMAYQMEYRLVIFDKMPSDNRFHFTPFTCDGTAKSEAIIVRSDSLKTIRLFANIK